MDASVKSYILRIYRFDRKSPGRLVGLVEEVGFKEKRAFTNLQELWDILRSPEKGAPVERGKRKEVTKKGRKSLETETKTKGGRAGQKAHGFSPDVQEENKHVDKA